MLVDTLQVPGRTLLIFWHGHFQEPMPLPNGSIIGDREFYAIRDYDQFRLRFVFRRQVGRAGTLHRSPLSALKPA